MSRHVLNTSYTCSLALRDAAVWLWGHAAVPVGKVLANAQRRALVASYNLAVRAHNQLEGWVFAPTARGARRAARFARRAELWSHTNVVRPIQLHLQFVGRVLRLLLWTNPRRVCIATARWMRDHLLRPASTASARCLRAVLRLHEWAGTRVNAMANAAYKHGVRPVWVRLLRFASAVYRNVALQLYNAWFTYIVLPAWVRALRVACAVYRRVAQVNNAFHRRLVLPAWDHTTAAARRAHTWAINWCLRPSTRAIGYINGHAIRLAHSYIAVPAHDWLLLPARRAAKWLHSHALQPTGRFLYRYTVNPSFQAAVHVLRFLLSLPGHLAATPGRILDLVYYIARRGWRPIPLADLRLRLVNVTAAAVESKTAMTTVRTPFAVLHNAFYTLLTQYVCLCFIRLHLSVMQCWS